MSTEQAYGKYLVIERHIFQFQDILLHFLKFNFNQQIFPLQHFFITFKIKYSIACSKFISPSLKFVNLRPLCTYNCGKDLSKKNENCTYEGIVSAGTVSPVPPLVVLSRGDAVDQLQCQAVSIHIVVIHTLILVHKHSCHPYSHPST